jgi:hypothetical protein
VIDILLSMQVSSRYVVTINFGEAYAALTRGRTKNAPPMHRDVVFVPSEITLLGEPYSGNGGLIVTGEVRWDRFRCPGRVQVLFQPRPKEPKGPMMRVGNEDDQGGMMDGSWILGQWGPIVRVTADTRTS